MKILIEDYQRRLKTAEKLIKEDETPISRVGIERLARLQTKASEYRTVISELEREMRKEIRVGDVWVIQLWYGDTPDYFYLSKEEAERIAQGDKERFYNNQRKLHADMSDEEFKTHYENNYKHLKYRVCTLSDAMYDAKEQAIIHAQHPDLYI